MQRFDQLFGDRFSQQAEQVMQNRCCHRLKTLTLLTVQLNNCILFVENQQPVALFISVCFCVFNLSAEPKAETLCLLLLNPLMPNINKHVFFFSE